MPDQVLWWVLFNLFVLGVLALDLGVLNRGAREVSVKKALAWSAVWVSLAFGFNLILYFWKGSELALQFLTGYLIEKSLSVDNIFVFLQVFSFFSVPAAFQHKVLFFGILGAIAMRAVFIVAGVALIEEFHWVIYVFGAFLVITAVKMSVHRKREVHPERNPVLMLVRRLLPINPGYDGAKFFTRNKGKLLATPLFVVLVLVETTDVVFAIDSIPAILAITTDTFVVYTSNIFAILGLRALYFALSGVVERFHYLHHGLAAVLAFVGLKMLLSGAYKIPTGLSLGAVAFILLSSVAFSLFRGKAAPAGKTA